MLGLRQVGRILLGVGLAFSAESLRAGVEPEISVRGDGRILHDWGHGSRYFFGRAVAFAAPIRANFLIRNDGDGTLNIASVSSDSPYFSVSGVASTIGAHSSDVFAIEFDPRRVGVRSAQITIVNDDRDENPYTFTVWGSVGKPPEIAVYCDDMFVPSGSGSTDLACLNLGSIPFRGGAFSRTFTIRNLGSDSLSIEEFAPRVTGIIDVSGPTGEIPPLDDSSFTVTIDPQDSGEFEFVASIQSSDPIEPIYWFGVRWEVTGDLETAEFNVTCGGLTVSSGAMPNHASGCLALGNKPVSGGTVTSNSFALENLGPGPLQIASVTSSSPQFSVIGLPSSLESGETDLFHITFDPDSLGVQTATITIESNNPDERLFSFTVSGEGTGEVTGYEVALTNEDSLRIGTSDGSPLVSWASAELGCFRALSDAEVRARTVDAWKSDWRSFSLPLGVPQGVGAGRFDVVIPGGLDPAGSEFAEKELYIALGNGPSLKSSDEVIVFRSGALIGETDPGSSRLTISLHDGSQVVYGAMRGEFVIPPLPTWGVVGKARPLGLEVAFPGMATRLQWQGRADRNYQVELSEDLRGPWAAQGEQIAGSDSLLTWFGLEDRVGSGFYRIVETAR